MLAGWRRDSGSIYRRHGHTNDYSVVFDMHDVEQERLERDFQWAKCGRRIQMGRVHIEPAHQGTGHINGSMNFLSQSGFQEETSCFPSKKRNEGSRLDSGPSEKKNIAENAH